MKQIKMHWKNEMELNDEKTPIQGSRMLFHVIVISSKGEYLILFRILIDSKNDEDAGNMKQKWKTKELL
ncbi:hypothetical protein T07_1210 [Trichinella nelsoni]|uniref:Uncharacterized protein n=1 Tax=Trichinella nelsoni TaxID=6336 RepID=A0A0V0RSP7_9BILA|nr:hypothetical protein T07_1210 [Trichinella nelsoni]